MYGRVYIICVFFNIQSLTNFENEPKTTEHTSFTTFSTESTTFSTESLLICVVKQNKRFKTALNFLPH